MQADLEALASRVEQAEGADRELDAAIAVALKIGARGLLPDDHEYLSRVRKGDECWPGTYWFHCRSGKSLRTAEPYTASLDAAMKLVPEGYDWAYLDKRAIVRKPKSLDHAFGEAAIPALALTAACLRARAPSRTAAEGEG